MLVVYVVALASTVAVPLATPAQSTGSVVSHEKLNKTIGSMIKYFKIDFI
jgi:hypothetical protein